MAAVAEVEGTEDRELTFRYSWFPLPSVLGFCGCRIWDKVLPDLVFLSAECGGSREEKHARRGVTDVEDWGVFDCTVGLPALLLPSRQS